MGKHDQHKGDKGHPAPKSAYHPTAEEPEEPAETPPGKQPPEPDEPPLRPREPDEPPGDLPPEPETPETDEPAERPAAGTTVALRPTELELDKALASLGREDKIALVTGRSNLSTADAATLAPDELDRRAREVIGELRALDRAADARAARERVGEAPEPEPIPGAPYGGVDAPRHYRFTAPMSYAHDGVLVSFGIGSIVNDRTHDLEQLQQAGARLEPCAPPALFSGS